MKIKIQIQSDPHSITIELATDTAKKPTTIRLSKAEAKSFLNIIETAIRAESFVLEYQA